MTLQHLIGNESEFPILNQWDFYNHAGVAPIPRCGADALRWYASRAAEFAYLDSGWYRLIDGLRASAARMINADKDEIAFIKNTSEGIATVAGGIDWRAGDRIVTTAVEYPANMYPWMDVGRRFGVELVTVPEVDANGARGVPIESILAAAGHPKTRLVTLSHVEYASGQRHDLAAIGRFCRERGILFCVDAIQSMGVLPIDVRATNIDYLAADGHKWLLGPEGAGIMYCRRELLEKTRPLIIGWMNVVNDQDYGNYHFELKTDARRFECGTHNVPGLLALKASLEMLLEAGVENCAERLKVLTDRVIAGVSGIGCRVLSPRGDGEWSGIVSFIMPGADHQQVFRRLREKKIEIAVREGRLRVSPHVYNTETQVHRLIGALEDAARERPAKRNRARG